jgi:GntR family transcriptional regulator
MFNRESISSRGIPKYRQLLQILRTGILRGEWQPGSQLPTEEALSESYGLSRGTVRKAMAQLEAERLIRIEQGVGTFVRSAPANAIPFHFDDRRPWLESTGKNVSYEVLANEVVPATMEVAERLSLSPTAPVIRIERLEFLDGEVNAYTLRHLDKELCPAILQADLTKASVHELLVELSELPLLRAEMTIEMHVLSEEEAKLLRSEAGVPGIIMDRLTYTAPNRPAVWYRAIFKERTFFGVCVDSQSCSDPA